MKKKSHPAWAETADGSVALRSEDGRLLYRLRSTNAGLWVQRERRRLDSRARLVQSAVFEDATAFTRWCDADTARFDYPVVFTSLQREGHFLLRGHERPSDAAPGHSAA